MLALVLEGRERYVGLGVLHRTFERPLTSFSLNGACLALTPFSRTPLALPQRGVDGCQPLLAEQQPSSHRTYLFPLSLSPTGVTPSLCSSPWRQAFARHTSSSEPPPSSEPRTLRAFAWSSVPRLGQPPAPGPPTSKGQNATLGIAVAFHKSTPLFQGECERMRLMRAEAFFTGRRGREFEESMYNTRGLERRGTQFIPI